MFRKFFLIVGLVLPIFATGCTGYFVSNRYATVSPGFIITKITLPGEMAPGDHEGLDYKVTGQTTGTSSQTNILGLVAFGDGGVTSAYEDAIRRSKADALIDIRSDSDVFSIMGLFTTTETKITGTGICYQE